MKFLPTDRAPGPDGFTGLFVKRCWHIIKQDCLQLFQDFYDGKITISNINGSLITLISKKQSPEGHNNFRPISLTNRVRSNTTGINYFAICHGRRQRHGWLTAKVFAICRGRQKGTAK